ncbi:hypothetical protein SAMN05444365_10721 [Micromonospora pattaloongensis]|uniref:Uncharacterized protein n=1 Tax=Micromonospora pattaloongensis TaxID=405436 RepID=A0A1H3R3P2_9ACTN|nr:hypothetical protein [Micromonospora pattaloongensis]SDZ19911.1 hypothetical protein SAMN05444365_10721 [Micromonospora pattaloongensis]
MTVATIVGGVLALFVAVAAFIYLGRRRTTPQALGRALRLLAFGATLGIAIALVPATTSDSGASAAYLLGVPMAVAVLPLVADLTGRAVGITTALGALVLLAWGLILGLGDGVYFVIPALVLGVAAVASITPRRGMSARNHGGQTVRAPE